MNFDRELLTCPICCDYFDNVVETVCGHAFCEFCLLKCLEHEENCPVCKEFPSPIHPSFTLRKIVEDFRKTSGLRKERVFNIFFFSNFWFTQKTKPKKKVVPYSFEEEKVSGNKAYSNGNFSEAIKHYNHALLIKPNPQTFANRAACWLKLKQFVLAKKDCESAITYDSTYIKAHLRKGICHENLGELKLAIQTFQKAQSLDIKKDFQNEIEECLERVQRLDDFTKGNSHPHSSLPSFSYSSSSSSSYSNHRSIPPDSFPSFSFPRPPPPRSPYFQPDPFREFLSDFF